MTGVIQEAAAMTGPTTRTSYQYDPPVNLRPSNTNSTMKNALPFFSAFFLLFSNLVYAGSATWNLNTASGDWNTATNWTPATVPNGPADIATLGVSNSTDVSVSTATEVDGIIFNPGASVFTITPQPALGVNALTISGAGITNYSGVTQNLSTSADGAKYGEIHFTNSATAGSGMQITNVGNVQRQGNNAYTVFFDSASAGSATIVNEGSPVGGGAGGTLFYDSSTAGNATFTNTGGSAIAGVIFFYDNSTADSATFFNENGVISFEDSSSPANGVFSNGDPAAETGAQIQLYSASAGNAIFHCYGSSVLWIGTGGADHATFIVEGGTLAGAFVSVGWTAEEGNFTVNGGTTNNGFGGLVLFSGVARGGSAKFTINGGTVSGASGGRVIFEDNSGEPRGPRAENAILIANGGRNGGYGGDIEFHGNSRGDTATIKLSGNGQLDVSGRGQSPDISIGSLEGNGRVFLGKSILAIGSNNVNTTFSGVMQDGGQGGGVGGSVTKAGSGRLILTGASTYTGVTTIESGILLVNNRKGSGTGTGMVQADGGTFGGAGIVAGAVSVGTGNGAGAILAPGKSGVKPGTLTIQSTLTLEADATYKVTLDSRTPASDKVSVAGVTLHNALILFNDVGNATLPVGTSFTVINNTSATPISGVFSNLVDGSSLTVGNNTFQADYEGGDGNDLTLTVIP